MSESDSFYSANDTSLILSDDDNTTYTLGEILHQCFSPQNNSVLNICHINAQSVPSHYSELIETFSGNNVHAILISESWFKPNLLSTSYSLPGYVLIRNDRTGRRGGGVAIYLRSDFCYNIIASSPSDGSSAAEYIFTEVLVKGAKLVLGVVYCPPSVEFVSELEPILETLSSEYSHHVIMGDFNTNLLNPSCPRSQNLSHLIESVSLHLLPLSATHHNTTGDDTWLDLILTSNPSLVQTHGQHPAPGFSHHDLIFIAYILKPPKPKPKIIFKRCYGRVNMDKLRSDATEIDWEPMFDAPTIDIKVSVFNDILKRLYDLHAPIKKVKLKHPPAPWLTTEIRDMMRRRDSAYRKFKRIRSACNWESFRVARNRCNQMIRNAKRRHIYQNVASLSPSNIWKFLGTVGVGKSQEFPELPRSIGLDDLNLHFSSTVPLDDLTKLHTISYLNGLSRPNLKPFQFSPVTLDEIDKSIKSIASKAVGYDDISRRMITTIQDLLLPAISHIINFSLISLEFPNSWRKAFVRPLPKVANPTAPSHFRPISILPFLSKVLEACVHKQLSGFVFKNSLLSPFQSGFRPGHSTTSALLKVTGDIRTGFENGLFTVLVLVDFSNAFNHVNHDLLLAALAGLSISSEVLTWMSSYLRGRQQSVRTENSSSEWRNLDAGVPQGGILSPLLFCIFINLLTKKLHIAYHLYADDLQLYIQARLDQLPAAIEELNQVLKTIKDWCDSFGLSVNPTKCQAMVLGSLRYICKVDLNSLPPIIYNGSKITFSTNLKDLGLHIDSSMTWQSHISNVSSKVINILRSFYRFKNFLPTPIKTLLVQTLIFPIIDYGDVCCFDLNSEKLNKLDRLLNNCLRFIFNLRKFDHVSSYRSKLHWLPIRQRRSVRALCLLYTLLHHPNPPEYLTPHFQYRCSRHDKNLRSTSNLLLSCPSHKSNSVHSSFNIQAILLWNALPPEIRMSNTRYTFKRRVRDLYLKQLADSK